MSDFLSITLDLLNGFLSTLQLFGLTLLFSLPLGLIICFGSMSKFKPLRWLVRTFVWIIRGTPLLLQLIIVYYGPGLILNTGLLPRFSAALLAFVINYSCYFSEISEQIVFIDVKLFFQHLQEPLIHLIFHFQTDHFSPLTFFKLLLDLF